MNGPLPVFDAHLHIVDPRFPLVENQGFLPEPFTVDRYRERITGLGIAGGAVVSASFQGFDQTFLLQALRDLGPSYVGVTQLPPTVTDQEIIDLNESGVRAVRFNVVRGGSAALDDLDRIARRVFDIAGWHSEIYIDSRQLPDITDRIERLPSVSLDHLGFHEDGLPHLLRLVENGVKVKATGFGRIDLDPEIAIRKIMAVDPGTLMVGTDLPSVRARRPFLDEDFDLIRRTVDPEHLPAVFWDNAARLYRIPPGA